MFFTSLAYTESGACHQICENPTYWFCLSHAIMITKLFLSNVVSHKMNLNNDLSMKEYHAIPSYISHLPTQKFAPLLSQTTAKGGAIESTLKARIG